MILNCEGPLSLTELSNHALKSLYINRSPGPDGLTE